MLCYPGYALKEIGVDVEICLGQQIVYGLANLDVLWMSPWTCKKYVTTLDIWMCD